MADHKKFVAKFEKANSSKETIIDPDKVRRVDTNSPRRDTGTGCVEPRTEIHFDNTMVKVRHTEEEVLEKLGWILPKAT